MRATKMLVPCNKFDIQEVEMIDMQKARETLEARGYSCKYDRQYKCLVFEHDLHTVRFFPKSEWFAGKSVQDGRGFKNLLKQLW